jgi:uncharacterized protein (DUF1499 family)
MKKISLFIPILLLINACSTTAPKQLTLSPEVFSGCPASPNCVSSDAQDELHAIAPFELNAPADQAWAEIKTVVMQLSRTHVVSEQDGYLHAESRSLIFRFVDDLQLQLREQEGIIAVYSASRVGHSDFGVNRQRIEELRLQLIQRGIIKNYHAQ